MSHRLSLKAAILINLNVMVGSGIFINTVLLSKNAGGLGAAAYALVGILLLPLILSISQLTKIYRGGTFYDYGSSLGSYGSFLTIGSYFLAKLSSCALAIHVCISLLQTIFPALARIPTLLLDLLVVLLFAALNTLNLRIGKRIQLLFMFCKFIPILFVLVVGFYLFNPGAFNPAFLYPAGMITSVPFILYAFMGFEVSCSLSRQLENPEKDGPRAILISYFLGIMIVCLFQFMFYGSLGSIFASLSTYLEAFPALLSLLALTPEQFNLLKILLHMGIAASALGSAYGIMYSNSWNLFELATKGQLVRQDLIMRLNSHSIPVMCVLIEACVVVTYLLITQGNQIPLQQISAFGSTIAYTLCVLSLTFVSGSRRLIPLLGLGSCLLLIGGSLRNFMLYGAIPALCFCSVLVIVSLLLYQKKS